ncbi:MAG: TetR/AcrR family transcriptional regulator, partial [Gammaproteobacteria bacterium]|nr:TetR/AcrR family transcriptional regulator [Gammaproteobacteria bacterium]
MSKSIENAEKKRYSIVQAALELFLQHGYGVTSMENVASEAGVTKQTVYRYFPSKETLFVAVMERIRAEESQPYRFGSDSLQIELENFG